MWRGLAGPIVVAVLATSSGCASGDREVTAVSAGTMSPSAVSLAASQVGASTVPPPSVPQPCDVADLAMWTAQITVGETDLDGTTATIRIRNDGVTLCDVDISADDTLGPDAEPSAWLAPGEWADLVLGPSGDDCIDPAALTEVTVLFGGIEVTVPTALVVPCGHAIVSFAPALPVEGDCAPDDLEAVESGQGTWVLIRNIGDHACHVGAGATAGDAPALNGPAIGDLAPGDVVGWLAEGTTACTPGPAELELDAVTIVADQLCAGAALHGPGRAYFGHEMSLFASSLATGDTLTIAWTFLDPFAQGR